MLDNKKSLKSVLALGYFDSVHKGHQEVIKSARILADKEGANLVICTFDGNLKSFFSEENTKVVYTKAEREEIYYSLGADEVYFAPVTAEFLSMGKREFLEHLNQKFNVLGYVCGKDYKFGKNGSGNANDLIDFANERSQKAVIIEIVPINEQKASSTLVKGLLEAGKIEEANEVLGRSYSVSGKVMRDRSVGKKLGFPTINIYPQNEKQSLKEGVYAGHIFIEDRKYKAIINYGSRPTFGLDERVIEAHILEFDGDLYDRQVKLFFDRFIRGVIKFDNAQMLKDRLKTDLDIVKGMNI